MPRFIMTQGPNAGDEYVMQGNQLVFGRTDDCDVLVNDAGVSRRHAQAVLLNGLVALVDMNSSNGTFVNGLPISRAFLLDGDEVRVGGALFTFVEDREGPAEISGVTVAGYRSSPGSAIVPGPRGSSGDEEDADPLSHTRMFQAESENANVAALKEVYLKLKSLYRVFYEVAQASSLKDMFSAVGRAVTLSTGIERVLFFLVTEKTGPGFQRYFTHGAVRLDDNQLNAPEFAPLLERAKADQRAVMARMEPDGRCVFGEADCNVLVVPLIRAGRVSSVMYLDNPASRAGISKNDVDFVTTLALQLAVRLNQFEQVQQLSHQNRELQRVADEEFNVVVQNEKMKQIMAVSARVAESDSTVLVTGESGTGKELIARTIHKFSTRGSKQLVAVNCAALHETLLESELFGHEKGAFTGAVEKRVGKFELADGGTLFLDEIGDISASAQAKLLRVLQEGELQRVGGNKTIKVDVRLIAATNKTLLDEVKAGKFRQDLFYRLRVIEISLPPLRDRRDDIPALAEYFFKQLRRKINTPVKKISPEAIQALVRYPFPGNVRELRNVIERGLVFAFGEALMPEHLPAEVLQQDLMLESQGGMAAVGAPGTGGSVPDYSDAQPVSLAEVEKRHIRHVLSFVKGNKLKAAQLLGISRTTLYEKLKLYELGADEAQA